MKDFSGVFLFLQATSQADMLASGSLILKLIKGR